ncbi:MAG: hypothetical protein V2J24_02545 [Pseudomonadales bacterium]|jgi:hypothetical protein|nr:hypothetical protein [Pseudomonadales bacterium]
MAFGGSGDRRTRARRLLPLFDAQLRFACALATARDETLAFALTHYTNFHRRFGYGVAGHGAPAAGWLAYLDAALRARDHAQLLVLSAEHFVRGTLEQPLPGHAVFGCFSYTRPEADGSVRIHFLDRDRRDGCGPLAASKQARRRAELARLVAALTQAHPEAKAIRGRSWLYHRAAYRRLFPPEYLATRTVVDAGLSFHGSGCWGQFQRHGGVDAAACAAFVARLPELDAEKPWRVFPLIPLAVTAPLDAFRRHYGRGGRELPGDGP